MLQKEKFDAILLDYKMPGNLDGIGVLIKIREKGIKTAVFLISGKPDIEKRLEEAGVKPLIAAVMPKPFDIEKLLLEIKKHTP
jgi:DNA-binding response OmpR family regulator